MKKYFLSKFIIIALLILSGLFFEKTIFCQESSFEIRNPGITYDAEGLRDPFKTYLPEDEKQPDTPVPTTPQSTSLPNLTMQGLVLTEKNPFVIINNKVLKVGDNIEGVEIINIGKEGVEISFNGQKQYLNSPAAKIKEGDKGGENEKK